MLVLIFKNVACPVDIYVRFLNYIAMCCCLFLVQGSPGLTGLVGPKGIRVSIFLKEAFMY